MESIDVVVIGAGLVGAAVAHELTACGYQVAVLESAGEPARGASGANAGILHTGFDSTPGTLEATLIASHNERWPQLFERLSIPYFKTGALLLATSVDDVARFPEIVNTARRNNVRVLPIDRAKLRAIEPEAAGRAAIYIPEEAITDPYEVVRRLLASVTVHYHARVISVEQNRAGSALVRTHTAAIMSRAVINCAGLFADEIARDDQFSIVPRRGDVVVYDATQPPVLRHILLPVPSERTKGVRVFPTLYGYLCAGPNAIDQTDKMTREPDPYALRDVRTSAAKLLPVLSALSPVDAWAGLRPSGRPHNYIMQWSPRVDAMLSVAAIRSSGLSSCLGIAGHVAALLRERAIEPRGKQLAVIPRDFGEARPWWQRPTG